MRKSQWAANSEATRAIIPGHPGFDRAQPIFMFGHFPAEPSAVESAQIVDEALLGIREDADLAAVVVHPHGHADTRTQDGHRFMFGVAPEQSPVVLPIAPVYYFWDIAPR